MGAHILACQIGNSMRICSHRMKVYLLIIHFNNQTLHFPMPMKEVGDRKFSDSNLIVCLRLAVDNNKAQEELCRLLSDSERSSECVKVRDFSFGPGSRSNRLAGKPPSDFV